MEANASFLPVGAVFTHASSYLRADTALLVGAVFNRARFHLCADTAPPVGAVFTHASSYLRADTARLLGSCCVHLNVCIISAGRRGF